MIAIFLVGHFVFNAIVYGFIWMTRFLVLEHKGQRPDREAKVYHITDIEDNHEVHLLENDELIEMRIYYKSSRAWGETTAIDTAEKWCLGLIH